MRHGPCGCPLLADIFPGGDLFSALNLDNPIGEQGLRASLTLERGYLMSASKTKNDSATVDLPEVEDGSVVVEGRDYGLLRKAGSKVIGVLISALDTADGASLAGAYLMGIIA